MNKHYLKSIRDSLPEYLKYIMAPVFRNKLINNPEFRHYYALLEKREQQTPGEILEYQFRCLKNILIYSYENVPYYNESFKKHSFDPYLLSDFEQIQKIPFLTRDIVNKNFERLISKEKVKNGYYIGSTGGSSTVPLRFLLDYDSIYRENAFIYYYRKKLGYGFNDKIIAFRQVEHTNKLWKFNPMYNELIFFPIMLSKNSIKKYAEKINSYRPGYLNGYLSAIWYFAKLLKEYKIDLDFQLKGIFLTSENINDRQRRFIEQFFKTESMTFYGHSERSVIAEEVTHKNYRFDPYYGYTEKIPGSGGHFSIVGTSFLNQKMPFIRYKTDDICIPEGEYYRIDGKRSSCVGLYGKNDEFIASTAFELEDPIFNKITSFQFIQDEKGKADLMIIVHKDFKIPELEIIRKEIDRQTKGIIDINIKIVDKLKLSPRGKFLRYISTIKEN